jgi:hypothetical protein
MEAKWVRSVRRARRENSSQGHSPIAARMYLQNVASSLVEPGDEDDFVTGCNTLQSLCKGLSNVHPCVGRSFPALSGRCSAPRKSGAHEADRMQGE